jgi:uncharacterized protein YjbI with pentapeptide repeats
MADSTYLNMLQKGVKAWNMWRQAHDVGTIDLSHAGLREASLSYINLAQADLRSSNLEGAHLIVANFSDANLRGANFRGANLGRANFRGADFRDADLSGANLSEANLGNANLNGANLTKAILNGAECAGADFSRAWVGGTSFADNDLSKVKGLDSVRHQSPSAISIDTLYKSGGHIPEIFLRGSGVPESLIVQIPAVIAAIQPIQFYSCFIKYSSKDEEFAYRLYSAMRDADIRVWFAPEDLKGGERLYDQIDEAIQVHDRLLLVLSESSLRSRWVETEIRRARKVELREGRRKLFPIRLVSYEALREWTCIDSSTGEDMAEEVRSYFIPDFSSWKSHDDFAQAFARLLADLKASS